MSEHAALRLARRALYRPHHASMSKRRFVSLVLDQLGSNGGTPLTTAWAQLVVDAFPQPNTAAALNLVLCRIAEAARDHAERAQPVLAVLSNAATQALVLAASVMQQLTESDLQDIPPSFGRNLRFGHDVFYPLREVLPTPTDLFAAVVPGSSALTFAPFLPSPKRIKLDMVTQRAMADVWNHFGIVQPNVATMHARLLVAWIADMPPSLDADTARARAQALAAQAVIPSVADPDRILSILKDIFAHMTALSPTHHPREDPLDVMAAQASPLLACVLEAIPLAGAAGSFITQALVYLTDVQVELLLLRALAWRQTTNVFPWTLAVVHALEEAGYYEILRRSSVRAVVLLTAQMHDAHLTNGAVDVIRHMLVSPWCDAVTFHACLPPMTALLTHVHTHRASVHPTALAKMVYVFETLSAFYPGYPERYGPVIVVLQQLKVPRLEPDTLAALKHESRAASVAAQSQGQSRSLDTRGVLGTRSETGLAGLDNLGNTCYINGVMQSLYLCDDVREQILQIPIDVNHEAARRAATNPHFRILRQTQLLFANLKWSERPTIVPRAFRACLDARWRGKDQQDATEFAKYIVDVLQMGINAWYQAVEGHMPTDESKRNESNAYLGKGLQTTKFNAFFGELQSVVTCGTCRTASEKRELFSELSLSVPVSTSPVSLDALWDALFHTASMTGENQYLCSTCGGKHDAVKKYTITRVPSVLLLNLKRNAFDMTTLSQTRIGTEVVMEADFHPRLDASGAAPRPHFALFGSVFHSGTSVHAGHYYACARHSNTAVNVAATHADANWALLNDATVSRTTFSQMQRIPKTFPGDAVYSMLFRRVEEKKVEVHASPEASAQEAALVAMVQRDTQAFFREREVAAAEQKQIAKQHRALEKIFREEQHRFQDVGTLSRVVQAGRGGVYDPTRDDFPEDDCDPDMM